MSLVLDGTAGITFNDSSTQATAGKVLQVVSVNYSTETTTTSTSFVDTGITATITPKFSTSKILVIVSVNGIVKTSGNTSTAIGLSLVRASTTIISNWSVNLGLTQSSSYLQTASSINYSDSPATTSATAYKVQFASTVSGQSIYVQQGSAMSTITLMEIAV
jgi:hypothetical protein